jgi:archaellum component FlaC
MAEVYPQDEENSSLRDLKLRDLEEKQNIIKDRLLLIGQNLIETKEETSEKFLTMRKEIEELKDDIKDMKSFIETISNELSKFAKKDELEILRRQAKIFQPLDFVRKSELKNFNLN